SKPSHGMPPHVTLLVPAPCDAAAIAEVLSEFEGFDVTFPRLERFPGTLWLAPEPAEPFRRMTETLVARFPEHQPYGGGFSEIVPHLTVAQAEFDAVAEAVEPLLPFRASARRAILVEQVERPR